MMTTNSVPWTRREPEPARGSLQGADDPGRMVRRDGGADIGRDSGLDDMLAQSFPASDPPSSTSGIARVQPRRLDSESSPNQVA
jgi:hypothetical protein